MPKLLDITLITVQIPPRQHLYILCYSFRHEQQDKIRYVVDDEKQYQEKKKRKKKEKEDET